MFSSIKKYDNFCWLKINPYLCTPKIQNNAKENISAFEKKEKKQAWIPFEDGFGEWPQNTVRQEKERAQKVEYFGRSGR